LYLEQKINGRLTGRVNVRTFATLARPVKGVAIQPIATHIVPKNFLAAVWLQFAEAVNWNKQYRVCRECGSCFELSPAKHTDRQYCSDLCKVNAYRVRKAIQQHYLAGTKPHEIAKFFDCEVEKVNAVIASMQKET
jgi:hypothetical protein